MIGYWGHPPRQVLDEIRKRYSGHELVDLDVDLGSPPSRIVPEAYCQIITNIVDNAVHLKDQLVAIVASVGDEKCSQGRFAARICRDLGLPVIEARNHATQRQPIAIATSQLPVREKVLKIMDTVHTANRQQYQPCQPTHGFWGVPPHDLGLLDLFPDTTHVFGWTRCVEAQVPADLEMECLVEPKLPTVFYSQSFCSKEALAKYLAEKYGGLYINADGPITGSVIAKVEAFIKLR